MTDAPTPAIHVRNGAVPAAVLADAFADLGLTAVTIEDVPGEGQLIQVHTAVTALLAHLAQAHGETPATALTRLAETLWAHLPDPNIQLLLVDTTTDISARLSPALPPTAYTALAAGRLALLRASASSPTIRGVANGCKSPGGSSRGTRWADWRWPRWRGVDIAEAPTGRPWGRCGMASARAVRHPDAGAHHSRLLHRPAGGTMMALPKPEQATVIERVPQPDCPIVRVLGLVTRLLGGRCLTAAAIVRPWPRAHQAELAAAARVARMTRGAGG